MVYYNNYHYYFYSWDQYSRNLCMFRNKIGGIDTLGYWTNIRAQKQHTMKCIVQDK